MKNFYKSFKNSKFAAILLILLLTFSLSSYSQSRQDTLYVGFDQINDPFDALDDTDDEPFTLTTDFGIVSNIKFEIIYDDTNFGTYIDRIQFSSDTPIRDFEDRPIFYAGPSYDLNNAFILDTTTTNYSGEWRIWVHEEDDVADADSALVQITYQFDTITTPQAVCKDTLIMLEPGGSVRLYPEEIDGGSVGVLSSNDSYFDCLELGTKTVTLTATATNGSTETCEATVEVTNIACKDTTLYLNASGEATLEGADLLSSAVTDCGAIDTMWLSQNTFTTADIGVNPVTVFARTEVNLDTSWCYSTVTVMDTLTVCKDTVLYLDETGAASLSASDLYVGGGVGVDSMWLSQYDFSCADIPTIDVTLYVEDNVGDTATCVSTVTVQDTVPPSVICQDITVRLDQSGAASITAAMIDNGSMDPCGIDTMYLDIYDFSTADVGDNAVTLYGEDIYGNIDSCTAVVTVEDIVSTLSCSNITVYLRPNGQYVLRAADLDLMTSFDSSVYGSIGDIAISASPRSFECAQAGKTIPVTITATLNGSVATCVSSVTVMDTTAAEITCVESYDVILDENASARIFPRYLLAGGTDDECGSISLSLDKTTFSCADVGANIVTLTSLDPSGNESTCVATVNVIDTVAVNYPPSIDAITDILLVDEDTFTVDLTGITAGADCTPQDLTITVETSNDELVTNMDVDYTQGAATGTLGLNLAPETGGQAIITVTLEDSEGATYMEEFNVSVTSTNAAPVVVMPMQDTIVFVDSVLSIPISSVLGDYFDDPDGDELTLSVMLENGDPLPAWAVFSNDTIVAEPMVEDTGCVMIVVEAMDLGGASATDTFEICVERVTAVDQIVASQFGIKLYPNPTRGQVFVDIQASSIQNVDLSVLDISGRQIIRKQFSVAERISFDLSQYVSGMYFVKLDIDGTQIMKKVIMDK